LDHSLVVDGSDFATKRRRRRDQEIASQGSGGNRRVRQMCEALWSRFDEVEQALRKTFRRATAALAVIGAGAAAKGYRIEARQPQAPGSPDASMPLPVDAYPDELDLEIWQSPN